MIDSSAVRGWISRHPGRCLLYAVLLASILAAAAIPLVVCANNGLALHLVNLPVLHHLSEEVGVSYEIHSARIWCRGVVVAELSGIDLKFNSEPVTAHVDSVELSRGGGVSAGGVRLGTSTTKDAITIDRIRTDLTLRKTETTGIRVLLDEPSAGSYLATQSVLVDRVSFVPRSQSVALDHLAVNGVEVRVSRDAKGNLNLARLPVLRSLGASLSQQLTGILSKLNHSLTRFRRLLAWALVGVTLFLVLLKLVVTRSPRWPRSAVTVLTVFLPFACYVLLFGRVSLIAFLVLGTLISILLAAVLWRITYRLAAEWHSRWEPCALDVLSPIALLPLLVILGTVPASLSPVFDLSITSTSVRSLSVVLHDQAGGIDLASLSMPQAENAGLALRFRPAERASVNLGLTSFSGSVKADLSSPLRKLEWLPAAWSSQRSLTFCGTVRDRAISGLAFQPAACIVKGSGLPQFQINASANVLLSPMELSYSAKSQAGFGSILLAFDAEGGEAAIRITNLQSLDKSALQIGGGSADVTFTPKISASLELDSMGLKASDARVDARSLKANLSVPPSINPGPLQVSLTLQDSVVRTSEQTVTIGSADLECSQIKGRVDRNVSVLAGLRSLAVTSRRSGDPSAWLHAGLPVLTLQARGRMSIEPIPHDFAGEAALRLARSDDPKVDYQNTALWTDKPLHFAIDVWKGVFDVPQQSVTVHQSIVSQVPQSASLSLGAQGQLFSLATPFHARAETHLHVSQLAPGMPSVRLEINDLDALAGVVLKGKAASFNTQYGSGWSVAALKDMSMALPELREIPEFSLETHGFFPHTPDAGSVSTRLNAVIPELPKQVVFRLNGKWPENADVPLLQVLTKSGAGIRVTDVTPRITRLSLPASRLEAFGASTDVSGIQTATGKGDLSLHSEMLLNKESLDSSITIPFPNDEGSLALNLQRTPEALHLALADRLPIGPLLSSFEPFLSQAGFNLEGVTSQAEIKTFAVTGRFSGTKLTALDAKLDIPPGLLAAVDFSKSSSQGATPSFRRIEIRLPSAGAAPGGLRLRISPAADATASSSSTDIALALDSLSFLGISPEAEEYRADLSLASRVKAILPADSTPSPNPLMEKLSLAGSDFRNQAASAAQMFSDSGPAPDNSLRDITWKLEMHNPSAQPFLSMGQDKASLALRALVEQIGWRAGDHAGLSLVSASIDIATDFRMHHGELVADGYVPIKLNLSLAGQPSKEMAIGVPFLALLAERLRPADTSDWLWDTKYYDSFWSDYQPSRANRESPSIIDAKEVSLGPLSIQQLRIPSELIRLAIGHKGSFQLDAPAAFQVLFGQGQGRVQSEIRWRRDASSPEKIQSAILDSRGTFSFSHLQLGAIGFAVEDGRLPLIEDEIDGQVSFGTDAYRINSEVLNRLASGFARPEDLEGLSARAKFKSNRPDPRLTGAVQFVASLQLKNLNDFLKQITRDLELYAPPRFLTYKSLLFNFETAKGQVAPDPNLLELRGVNFYSIDPIVVDGAIHVHLGGKGETLSLKSLASLARELISAAGAGGSGKQ